MLQFRFADFGDLPAISSIWQEAFPSDSFAEITAFLERVELSQECLLAVEEGIPVSMVFLLPARLTVKNCSYPLQYIYAAATRKTCRGRGIFAELLKHAWDAAIARGQAGSFLRPAQPSLFDYYARLDYAPFFYSRTVCGAAVADAEEVTVTPLSAEAYASYRGYFLKGPFVEWEPRFVEYAMGEAALLESNNKQSCALYSKRGSTLFIAEWCGDLALEKVGGVLAQLCNCETFECRTVSRDHSEPFGMLKQFKNIEIEKEAIPFMGLALD